MTIIHDELFKLAEFAHPTRLIYLPHLENLELAIWAIKFMTPKRMKCVSILTLSANLWRNFELGRTSVRPYRRTHFSMMKVYQKEKWCDRMDLD
jgi:hypothetical protein